MTWPSTLPTILPLLILTPSRKQAEEDRKLRLKLKEIRIKGEVLDGVKISKGRIVGRVDGHVIYDPFAWLIGGFPKECMHAERVVWDCGQEFGVVNEFWLISLRLYRKAQGKACTQACRNRRRDQKSMDYGACIGQYEEVQCIVWNKRWG